MIQLMDLFAKRKAANARTFEEGRALGMQAKRDRGELAREEVIKPGLITTSTSDAEIAARAARMAHQHGAPVGLCEYLLRLEKRLSALELAV